MEGGFIYVMRNKEHRGENTRKIGKTENPKRRLRDANGETYSPPEWGFELLKWVDNHHDSEKLINKLLDSLGMRMYPTHRGKEFFNVPFSTSKAIFDLIPGTYYDPSNPPSTIQETVNEENNSSDDEVINGKSFKDMREYIPNNSQIRHKVSDGQEWVGTYDSITNVIVYEGKDYYSLTEFANDHAFKVTGTKVNRSGWSECQIFEDNTWKSLRSRSKIQA